MNAVRVCQTVACALACVGLMCPCHGFADQDDNAEQRVEDSGLARVPTTIDVSLDGMNGLHGTLVDSNGNTIQATRVNLTGPDGSRVSVVTSQTGEFHVPRVRGGTYMAQVADADYLLRAWAPGTAPPHAPPQVLIVYPGQAAAGQYVPMKCLFTCPTFLALVGGAAIAIPVAIHNYRQDRDSGS